MIDLSPAKLSKDRDAITAYVLAALILFAPPEVQARLADHWQILAVLLGVPAAGRYTLRRGHQSGVAQAAAMNGAQPAPSVMVGGVPLSAEDLAEIETKTAEARGAGE